ncbi:hypothetical protein CJ030_MR7G008112 [Morella rubra]|uniref:WAT1-related protein n=1 Tax=Morella rubra TaxID=262757 RepID=A0A6A1V2N3_9ROSI|nr:hypothetical protein CJ030_MR7G008112 [Morella rubra]
MVVLQIGYTGAILLCKLAAEDGMNLRVLIAYRMLFASAFMVPLAIIFERGSLFQNLYIESLALTSTTFAAAVGNLAPLITFILAVSVGMERLNLKTMEGRAKVLGTFIGMGGVTLLTLYRGREIHLWSTHLNLLHRGADQTGLLSSPHRKSENLPLGCVMGVGSCLSSAVWLIIQAKMSEKYHCHCSSTALMCTMGAIQAVVFALCVERDWSQWKLGWNIRLLTASFTGIIVSGLMVILTAWCLHMRGPLFVSIFSPLTLVSVSIVGSLVLDEKLHLGSILGAVLIVGGLYLVLWGKGKETKEITKPEPSEISRESELIDIVPARPNAS